ncbi:hypothetical protein HAX54_006343, partial [Datura stramonium]|nr:hypothetical protein [Datura stramonium]
MPLERLQTKDRLVKWELLPQLNICAITKSRVMITCSLSAATQLGYGTTCYSDQASLDMPESEWTRNNGQSQNVIENNVIRQNCIEYASLKQSTTYSWKGIRESLLTQRRRITN